MRVTVLPMLKVYPRACGGTHVVPAPRVAMPGLSPRLRGNLNSRKPIKTYTRSIPAPAGEPIQEGGIVLIALGLSPRLRGEPSKPT